MIFDINKVRAQFPALHIKDDGKDRIYLDGPAGTQVPQSVIDAVSDCFLAANANLGGQFPTSQNAAGIVADTRAVLADMLGAQTPDSIVLGPSMTALTKQIAYAMGEYLKPGDRIVLSRMDHDANVSPWLDMAKRLGLEIDWLDLDTQRFQLDLEPLENYLKDGARFIAVGYASNVLGTINDVETICQIAQRYGALTYVDAVHYAPHRAIDVAKLGCDMLVCSAYKFFGPHCAALFIKPGLMAELKADPLRPAPQDGPAKFESGTMNHEGIAGTLAAVTYLQSLSSVQGSRRTQLLDAFAAIETHETGLVWALINGVKSLNGYTLHGITDQSLSHHRAPTVSITHDSISPQALCQLLTQANIFCWGGHSYAIEPLGKLGLLETGGVLRLGIAHYNTLDEINRTLESLENISP